MLYLDNIVDAEDAQWEVQGVNKEQDTMTWAGVARPIQRGDHEGNQPLTNQ